jgi:hypothetical protein
VLLAVRPMTIMAMMASPIAASPYASACQFGPSGSNAVIPLKPAMLRKIAAIAKDSPAPKA